MSSVAFLGRSSKCTKIVGDWSCTRDSTGELTAPPDPLSEFKGPTSKAPSSKGREERAARRQNDLCPGVRNSRAVVSAVRTAINILYVTLLTRFSASYDACFMADKPSVWSEPASLSVGDSVDLKCTVTFGGPEMDARSPPDTVGMFPQISISLGPDRPMDMSVASITHDPGKPGTKKHRLIVVSIMYTARHRKRAIF